MSDVYLGVGGRLLRWASRAAQRTKRTSRLYVYRSLLVIHEDAVVRCYTPVVITKSVMCIRGGGVIFDVCNNFDRALT